MYPFRICMVLLIIACMNTLTESPAAVIDASVREVYETNVNPLLAGGEIFCGDTDCDVKSVLSASRLDENGIRRSAEAGTGTGDLHTVLSVGAEVSTEVGVETELSIRAGIVRDRFDTFTELNASKIRVSAGLFKQFSDMNSVRFGLSAGRMLYRANALDADTWTASCDVMQQLTPRLWLDEGLLYEKNSARNVSFSYRGRGLGVRAGYGIAERIIITADYAYLLKKFDGRTEMKIRSLKLGGARQIANVSHIVASYERQSYLSEPRDARGRNAIFSLGVGFSY